MNRFCLRYTIKKDNEGMLLRDFLKEQHISKAALIDIKFNGGALHVNGSAVTVRSVLNEGDLVEVYFPKETPSEELKPQKMPLDIHYEDNYVLVINKPAGIASIPSREYRSGTLANGILYYYLSKGYETTIHIVTRLDKDTSGLMLIAKNRHAHHLFSLQQKLFGVKRRYEAIVHGCMTKELPPHGIVNAPIGRKETSIIEREVREDGQSSLTHYQVLEVSEKWSLVSLCLETGRTHQIRVHMAYLGFPLIGDTLYGGMPMDDLNRQALHSCELTFYHPVLKKELHFTSDYPMDMSSIVGLK
ncbi:RluA family pseudouridine synthase [Sutcliffiella rhizosphaerae]|uniref:Pseudouridine synthase n=1 Tax=Sutcliffiella rhizosphaerae TaxID=2880967 RepID=A0ABN8AC75_9BACI|nr:RluA family pseudouridine synthase [Sutcliffiella rhizosphaerae]CAG9622828.1 hypothetical protein BACCIP111883_03619 [Sutcliffiella rhizosphaerae]